MNLPKPKISLSGRKKYYLIYSICFVITAFLVYFWYLSANRTLIWREDGWQQHYKSLIYYSKYLRSIIKGLLLRHELVIPNWDFSIGHGSDILATLHYYTIGDPLSIFSIFFSESSMYLYYDAAIILRLFLSGIAFSELCFEKGKEKSYAVLAGSMAYVFCEWTFFIIRHPFFLNPMLYFPLLILGIEKIISKKRPYLFIITVTISALCNFYFFYMMVLAVIIYVITRLIILYRQNIKEYLYPLVRIALSSILGVIMSAVIFLPLAYVFIGDSRISEQYSLRIFYPLEYYANLPKLFIASENMYNTCMGYSIPVLLAVFLMYYNRKKYQLTKTLFIICIVMTSFPIFARIFNGMAYPINRWIWAFALLSAYILTLMWPSLMNLKAKEGIFLFKCLTAYFVICLILEYSRSENAFGQLLLAFILLFIIFPIPDMAAFITYKRKQQLTILIALVSIVINSYWQTSPNEGNEATTYMEVKQLTLNDNETVAIADTAASDGVDEFYRYSGRNLTENVNMLVGISSTQYFWSLLNPKIGEYRSKMDILENRSFDPSNFDDRAGLNSLASVLYYSVPQNDSAPAPYGFTYVDSANSQSSYKIYRNDYALPLTYTYDSYMSADIWETLSSPEKEEAMLQSVVLSEDAKYTASAQPDLSSYEIPYTIEYNDNGITLQDNTFITTTTDTGATLNFEAPPNCEVFVTITGMQFKKSSKYDLYFGDPSLDPLDLYNDSKWDSLDYVSQYKIKKEKLYWSDMENPKISIVMKSSANESKILQYYTKDYSFYSGRHDFAANFRSLEEGLSSISLSFNQQGVYSFDSLKVICQPMNNYVNQIEALRSNTLQNVNIDTDSVSGDITLEAPALLCFSIPYSSGWSAYVDGQKTKLYQANIMHMALDLDAGSHEIKLVYRTPFLREGIYISLCGIVIFIILIAVNEKRLRKNKRNLKQI